MNYQDIQKEQEYICKKYKTDYVETPEIFKIGVSDNVDSGDMPINGLRHQLDGVTSGWFIWAGEEFSDAEDFFKPLHISHLKEKCPLALKFLGLPPGWRFLTDGDYEDVWFDEDLLKL